MRSRTVGIGMFCCSFKPPPKTAAAAGIAPLTITFVSDTLSGVSFFACYRSNPPPSLPSCRSGAVHGTGREGGLFGFAKSEQTAAETAGYHGHYAQSGKCEGGVWRVGRGGRVDSLAGFARSPG